MCHNYAGLLDSLKVATFVSEEAGRAAVTVLALPADCNPTFPSWRSPRVCLLGPAAIPSCRPEENVPTVVSLASRLVWKCTQTWMGFCPSHCSCCWWCCCRCLTSLSPAAHLRTVGTADLYDLNLQCWTFTNSKSLLLKTNLFLCLRVAFILNTIQQV